MKIKILTCENIAVIFNYGTDNFEITDCPLIYPITFDLNQVINDFVNHYVQTYKVYPDKDILTYFGNCKLTTFELVEVKESQFVPAY